MDTRQYGNGVASGLSINPDSVEVRGAVKIIQPRDEVIDATEDARNVSSHVRDFLAIHRRVEIFVALGYNRKGLLTICARARRGEDTAPLCVPISDPLLLPDAIKVFAVADEKLSLGKGDRRTQVIVALLAHRD